MCVCVSPEAAGGQPHQSWRLKLNHLEKVCVCVFLNICMPLCVCFRCVVIMYCVRQDVGTDSVCVCVSLCI